MFLGALLEILNFAGDVMALKTDLVFAFADDLKAHTTSLVALIIVAAILKKLGDESDMSSGPS